MRTGKVQTRAEAASGTALRLVAVDAEDLERRFRADVWQATELGVPAARGRSSVSFTPIDSPWLREATKWNPPSTGTGAHPAEVRLSPPATAPPRHSPITATHSTRQRGAAARGDTLDVWDASQ